jgi:hypothetical protein
MPVVYLPNLSTAMGNYHVLMFHIQNVYVILLKHLTTALLGVLVIIEIPIVQQL